MTDSILQTEPPGLKVQYNHDLDVSEDFLKLFPEISEALKDQRLLKEFYFHDEKAKAHKKKFHSLGLWSLILGVIPLFSAASLLVVGEEDFSRWIWAYFAAHLLGVVSIGLVFWNYRKRHRMLWCQALFCRERLRQWHFQKFLNGRLIEMLVKDQAGYKKELNRQWTKLEQVLSNSDAEMREFISSPSENLSFEVVGYSDDATAMLVFEALQILRIEHQLRYSKRKTEDQGIENEMSIKEKAMVSEKVASATLGFAVFLSVLAAILSVIHELHWLSLNYLTINRHLGVAALILAIISAASRAYRAGFTLPDESESYEEYCDRIREIKIIFKRDSNNQVRLAQLEQLEEEAAIEMRRFLQMKLRATFLS